MTDNAPPSANPADGQSLAGVLRLAVSKMLQGVDTMLPARVIAYDRATNRATVQPVVQVLTTTGARVARAPIASVPVYQAAGGDFILSFPLKPGDLGELHASDRDISLFLQSLEDGAPNTLRSRSFADAVFYPDRIRQFTLAGEDAERAVLQTADGAVRVSVGSDSVIIASSAARMVLTGSALEVTAPAVNFDTPLATFSGDVTITGALEVAGIEFATHVHSGVAVGLAKTGAPGNP